MLDTIAAISSGYINQPISIIRVSGSEAFFVVSKIFDGKIGNHRTVTYGYIVENGVNIDEVMITWLVGPNTFNGEDIVEINAHGGTVVTNKILKMLLANGARLAEPGEFSRRAFLNGKMDLIKVEAIHDLIFANTEESAALSVGKFTGRTSQLINELISKLVEIISVCEINIDYPEYEDVEIFTQNVLLAKLKILEKEMKEIVEASKSSRYIFQGIKVAIVGKPNSGKSSLLNALLNEKKAIVSDTPGTTRDVVEGFSQLGEVLLNLRDTAGIRNTVDEVERFGIEKSMQQIAEADLIIHLVDIDDGEDKDEVTQKILDASQGKKYLRVLSKDDSQSAKELSISSKNLQINRLTDEIKNIYPTIDIDTTKILNNTRQMTHLEKSFNHLSEAILNLERGFLPDEVIVDIQLAWEELSNILGRANQENLLDEMFKNFCLGK